MKKYRLTHTSGTKHKIKNAFILVIPYHQTLFILSFYTQKCNSQAALLRNTLLCQRLFPIKLYFCSRK